jgi:hypothetical protein
MKILSLFKIKQKNLKGRKLFFAKLNYKVIKLLLTRKNKENSLIDYFGKGFGYRINHGLALEGNGYIPKDFPFCV